MTIGDHLKNIKNLQAKLIIESNSDNTNKKEWELVPECVQQAVGLLLYMKHELDYLPDDIIDRINGVIHSIECTDEWNN